ncbi:MAG: CoA pyrophosphatase [Myxococcota bacterium]
MEQPGLRRSAVAILLRFDRGSPELLLMKRAERVGDRWSGQISLPGGRESAGDLDLRATAIRETHEEVGLDLHAVARPLGQIDTVRARARGAALPLTITPHVFVQTASAPLVLGDEAVAAFWLPMDRAITGELSSTYRVHLGERTRDLPCWNYDGYTIWGLTYMIVHRMLKIVGVDMGREHLIIT